MIYVFYVLTILICVGIVISFYNFECLLGCYWFAVGFLSAFGVIEFGNGNISYAVANILPAVTALICILILKIKQLSAKKI